MRFPSTLWRHTFTELFKLVLLTTSILVTATSFAAAVRWFADGKLGPLDFMKFMFFAMLPMLAYTLPFAACFGATLTYHRMSQDNEVTAAHAGGIGHRGVLMPAIIAGVVLAGTLGALNDYIIPKFLRSMESLIANDLTKFMVNSINKGEAVEFGDIVINAEHVFENIISEDDENDAALIQAGVTKHFIFRKFIGLQFDDNGGINYEATSRVAHLYLLPGEHDDGSSGNHIARFVLQDYAMFGEEGLATGELISLIDMEIPNAFESNPKYLTNFELRALRHDPDEMGFINRQRIDLAYHIGERASTTAIRERLREHGSFRLRTVMGDTLTVYGSGIRWVHEDGWVLSPPFGQQDIRVELTPGPETKLTGAERVVHVAELADFRTHIGGGPRLRDLTFDLRLRDVSADRDDGRAPDRKELTYNKLTLVDSPVDALLERPSAELIEMARPRVETPNPDQFLIRSYNKLVDSIAFLNREITSKYNERLAMSASCLVMVVCGAVVAIKLSNAQPLVVYLWSFFPALVTVITISGGHQIVTKSGSFGLIVLWGGVLALTVYSFITYRILSRH